MKAKTLIAPLAKRALVLADALDTGRDAFSKKAHTDSRHLKTWRSNAARCAGSSVLTAVFGGLAVMALARLIDASRKHQVWKKEDQRLDTDLEDAFEASDPVAKY